MIFIVLMIMAINYYANSTSYTQAQMLVMTNSVVGGVYKQFARVGEYFRLRSDNDMLAAELARLQNELTAYRAMMPDTLVYELASQVGDYVVMQASVINNTLMRRQNFITLYRGRRDGVEREMAVITPEGYIVGYIMEVGERNSVAISVLNTDFRTSGRIKGRDYLGSVLWTGRSPEYVTLTEIHRYAEIAVGDTVVTDYSSRFPKDVVIGVVENYQITEAGYYDVRVRLAARFPALRRVLLVRYHDMAERLWLEEYRPN